MRAAVFVCAALLAVPAASAGEKSKPTSLTPKEIADGWILLFDGETTFGLDIAGESRVENGVLKFGGNKQTTLTFTTRFEDYELRYLYARKGLGAWFHLGTSGLSLPLVYSASQWHAIDLIAVIEVRPLGNAVLRGGADKNQKPLPWSEGIVRRVKDDRVSYFVPPGAKPEAEVRFPDPPSSNGPPVWKVAAGSEVAIHTLKLKPLNTKPLFNGKDLTGWNVFDDPKRAKSKFTVEDGTIRVKDGPGDLQTEGKYGDFILQLECKSNGKHLNSGIFFRCRPNEYQNGYEAQIRNEFTAEPTQEYVVEQFDPKTNKLVGKEKMKSPAVDFGTGAIYRRVPARKEASKDGEWFTLTVVARGNHFATWVNGVQQVDWTDNRPPSDNARTGFRREAGHLSIQGHDPTTDLSFRNIRIAELPSR